MSSSFVGDLQEANDVLLVSQYLFTKSGRCLPIIDPDQLQKYLIIGRLVYSVKGFVISIGEPTLKIKGVPHLSTWHVQGRLI